MDMSRRDLFSTVMACVPRASLSAMKYEVKAEKACRPQGCGTHGRHTRGRTR